MSPIDDLIKELAPEGVPFKALGDVGEFIRGSGLQKSDLTDDGVPAIHYGQVHTTYGTWATETISFVDPDFARTLRRAAPGDLVLATTSEDDEAVAKAVAWLGDADAAVSGDAYIYRHTLDPKYVAYYFQSVQFQDQKKRSITGTKVRRISGDALARIVIPVPPIEVQRAIVEDLEQLGSSRARLEGDLKAELELRQRQYSHYRTRLLISSDDDAPAKNIPLGDFAVFKYGYTASAQDDGDYRFIRITDITSTGKLNRSGAKYVGASAAASDYVVRSGDLLMARTGGTYGKTMLVRDGEPSVYASFLIRIQIDPEIMLPSYYWHFAQSDLYWSQAAAMVSTGGQPQFNANVLKRVVVPVPPLEKQRQIVEVLDEFDTFVSELSEVLVTECDARRKQYEYYRDRLFAFGELAA